MIPINILLWFILDLPLFVLLDIPGDNLQSEITIKYILFSILMTVAIFGSNWKRFKLIFYIQPMYRDLRLKKAFTPEESIKARKPLVRSFIIRFVLYVVIFPLFVLWQYPLEHFWEYVILCLFSGTFSFCIDYPEHLYNYMVTKIEDHLEEADKAYFTSFKGTWGSMAYYVVIAVGIWAMVYF